MKKVVLIMLVFSMFMACSSEEEAIKKISEEESMEIVDSEVNVKFNKVYCWINLMPGPDAKPKFNVGGELQLYKSDEYDFNKMNLSGVEIYQSEEKIYSLKLSVREDENLSTEDMRFKIFSNLKEVNPVETLDSESPVDAKFIFEYDSKQYLYYVNDIKIDKAY